MNEERKQRYLKWADRRVSDQKARFFEKMAQYEDSVFQKDACEWSKEQLIVFLKQLDLWSVYTLYNVYRIYASYCRWCMGEGLSDQAVSLDNSDIAECVAIDKYKRYMISRNQIESWVHALPNPCDSFMLLAFYEGLRGENNCEVIDLNIADINGTEIYIKSRDKTMSFSSDLISYAEQSESSTTYISQNNKLFYFCPRPGYVLKTVARGDNDFDPKLMVRVIARRMKKLGEDKMLEDISPVMLSEAGRFQLIKELLKEHSLNDLFGRERLLHEDRFGEINNRALIKEVYIRLLK